MSLLPQAGTAILPRLGANLLSCVNGTAFIHLRRSSSKINYTSYPVRTIRPKNRFLLSYQPLCHYQYLRALQRPPQQFPTADECSEEPQTSQKKGHWDWVKWCETIFSWQMGLGAIALYVLNHEYDFPEEFCLVCNPHHPVGRIRSMTVQAALCPRHKEELYGRSDEWNNE